ncbi:hypothetical protein LPMP_090470 [Leishmania panamensis]|uniref:Mon2 C-terminal domain-containing protein n=1 Tax=Leishmania panamensis TaxID=5679 RepID=A0A088RJ70_LEIPA|nr:hypothetical protein LPMP_090470 [Leishmania panamensis]AIN95963.1 hypothetical protein LPMP_090470 [Leishmania panamensis]
MGAPTTPQPALSNALSGGATAASLLCPAAEPATDVRHLAHAIFHTNLENLLVESTKHCSLVALRDAIQATRQRQYDPASLFETLYIACILLAERSAGGTGIMTRRYGSSAAHPTPSSPPTGRRLSHSSSSTALHAMGSANELPHAPVTAAEAASQPTAGTQANCAVSSPHAPYYRHHAASRALLLQSIGDIGKLIALALLPVTQLVGQRVADLVRALAFQSSPSPTTQYTLLSTELPARTTLPRQLRVISASTASSIVLQSHSTAPRDTELSSGVFDPSLSGGAVPSATAAATAAVSAPGPVQLVHDDEVLVRLLQMTAAAASRCPLGSSALAELYGVLLLFYSGVAPMSMLEATCEATLTHHIHAVLTALHNSEAGDDEDVLHRSSPSVALMASTFTAQLQGVAFIRDICRLMIGIRTRWLYLNPYRTTSSVPSGAEGGGGAPAVSGSNCSNKKSAPVPYGGSTPSSMAGITASVAAAAADAERQRSEEQQHFSRAPSLSSRSMLESLATPSLLTQNELDAQSAAAVSAAGGRGGTAELTSLSSLTITTPSCAAMETVPERLRLFLVRTVTLFFKEHAKALAAPVMETKSVGGEGGGVSGDPTVTSAAAVSMHSPPYVQCLNDCCFSVALWGLREMGITVSMQPPPALFVEVQQQQQRDGSFSGTPCSLEMFTCTQQLALVSISSHLQSMTNSTQVLLEAHEQLLQRLCRHRKPCVASLSPWFGSSGDVSGGALMSSDDPERLSQAATVVLSLWRKTLTSVSFLWELLQLRSMRSDHHDDSSAEAVAAGMSEDVEEHRSSGLYSEEVWQPSSDVNWNGYNSDNSGNGDRSCGGTGVASRQWSQSPNGSPLYHRWPLPGLSRSRHYLTGSQSALGGGDSENEHASTPVALGFANAAAASEEGGGGGVDVTGVPSLVRLVLSVQAVVVSHIQPPPTTTIQASADDRRGGSDGEEAEEAALTRSPLLPITPPRFLSAGDTGDGSLGERSLKPSPLQIKTAPANAYEAAAVSTPLCLCTTNASTAYQCFTEALNCLTAFGQLFSQLVSSVTATEKGQVLGWCRACFLALHPHLLHCEQLCLPHLRYEEDVLPVVLKATGYWVQVSCILQLPGERDSYLAALVDVLRAQDSVAGHLVALAPPTASGMSDASSPTTATLLEALLTLNDVCAAAEPVVPGSVAAAALSLSDDRDAAPPDSSGGAKGMQQYAPTMPSWGVGWLRRRSRTTSSSTLGNTVTPARPSGGRSGSWIMSLPQSQMNAAPSRIGTPLLTASAPYSKQQQSAPASLAMSSVLTSRGWRAPAVQHAVILGVCRLQHKIFIMKTLHVIANTLGAQLRSGWALLARGFAMTEPLLHMLKRLLSWIEESTEEQEQEDQLLSDALHLRDALRSLCVHNACHLPYTQFELFFAELMRATVALGPAASSPQQDGAALAVNEWACGDLHVTAPYTTASSRLPRHHPQGCGDQWVLTSECLSVSLLAMLPFIDLRYTDAAAGTASEDVGGHIGGSSRPSPQAGQVQHQRTGAVARALHLWELETKVCRYVTDHQHVERWGTTLLTMMRAHKGALLAATASSCVEPAAAVLDTPLVSGNLSQEETRTIELVLSTVVSHVATVAVQLCRSAGRHQIAAVASAGGGGGSLLSDTAIAAPSSSYQAVQSAALVLTSGPFAAVPLTQVANALFATTASGSSLAVSAAKDCPAGVGGSCGPPLLPFVQADPRQSTSRLLAAVHRSSQAIALHNSLDANRSSAPTAPPATASGNLDLLEQLLARPFALLDGVYHEWQRQYAGSPSRGGGQGGRSATAAATNVAEQRGREDRTSPALLETDEGLAPPQIEERSASLGALETSAASSVVAAAVPQILANAAAAVLMDVVKIVQSYGEDIDGAAWESILSLLQRTTMVTKADGDVLTSTSATGTGGSSSILQSSVITNSVGGRSASSSSLLLEKLGIINAPSTAAGAATSSSQAVESLNTAFRALESIQHNYIPRLKVDGLHRLIVCVGAFTVHRVDGGTAGERKLHTNLSAVQLLWSIADYLAVFGREAVEEIKRCNVDNNASRGSIGVVRVTTVDCVSVAAGGAPESPARYSDSVSVVQQQQDRLWCSLLWQLRNGCLDDRQEVRQSALQTFFALVQTYGWRFSAVCWRCVLLDVLLPLMEVAAVATELCATPPPSPLPSALGGDGATVVVAEAGGCSPDTTMPQLLRSFIDHPAQLEEVRVALFDAGGRLLVTHYARMQAATAAAEDDKDDATQVLERFLRLCGDVCVVLRGTSGEQAALAAVHALHGLLVEMPEKGLHAHGVHLAWSALERLILCGGGNDCADEPPADLREGTANAPHVHRRGKQCTIAVMAAAVAALCDSFRLQRLATAAPDAAADLTTSTQSSTVERSHSTTGFSSFFSGWGSGGFGAAAPAPAVKSISGAGLRHGGSSSPTQYFTRLLFLLQAVTRCPAVVNSYYFPNKAQSTLLEGVTAVWPTLSSCEAQTMWNGVLLSAFPSAATLKSFVLQGVYESVSITVGDDEVTTNARATAASALIPLKSVMPPGSHPGYLSSVMETMNTLILHHMGIDPLGAAAAKRRESDALPPNPASANTPAAATETPATTTNENHARLVFMAPSTLQVTGTLLLLHLASAEILTEPPRLGSAPFTLPALFLEECVTLLQRTLWETVLARTPTPSSSLPTPSTEVSSVSALTAAAVQCRQDGVAALCGVFEQLLTTTSTVVRHLEATPQTGAAATSGTTATPTTTMLPPHVTAALQSLDLLVDILGEVVHFAMEQYEDVICATTAITALSIASTAEGVALDRVARRSLALLQRWADAVAATPTGRLPPLSSASTLQHHHQHHHTRSGSDSSHMPLSLQGTVACHEAPAQSQRASHASATAPAAASRSQLQKVAQASMESRNKAIIAQFVSNPDDASAGALLVDTLRDMLQSAQNNARVGPRAGSGAATKNLLSMMPDLLRLVACSSREPKRSAAAITREQEIREILAKLLTMVTEEQQNHLPNQAESREGGGHQEVG